MTDDRLPAELEVTGLVRQIGAQGGFAAVMKRGDPERGSLLLFVSSRGRHCACLERALTDNGRYAWASVGPSESASSTEIDAFLAQRVRFDPDLWAVELDIADAERFIAETMLTG